MLAEEPAEGCGRREKTAEMTPRSSARDLPGSVHLSPPLAKTGGNTKKATRPSSFTPKTEVTLPLPVPISPRNISGKRYGNIGTERCQVIENRPDDSITSQTPQRRTNRDLEDSHESCSMRGYRLAAIRRSILDLCSLHVSSYMRGL